MFTYPGETLPDPSRLPNGRVEGEEWRDASESFQPLQHARVGTKGQNIVDSLALGTLWLSLYVWVEQVQQQPNLSDCGLYLCQYTEAIFFNPIKDFTLPITSIRF